jgi:hypothetical protein
VVAVEFVTEVEESNVVDVEIPPGTRSPVAVRTLVVVVVVRVRVVKVPGTKIPCRAQKPYTSPIKRGIS